jgi:flagellar protein FlaF
MSGRDIEADVLTKAAFKLKTCQDNWAAASKDERLVSALKFNQRIWTILQAELERPENHLPDELKVNLFKLSVFIDKRTLEAIAYPSPEKLTILIDINNNIAAGLRMRSETLPSKAAA